MKAHLSFAYATRSFIGFLQGTEKSLHTVKNYTSDLRTFQDFLENKLSSKPVSLTQISRDDLERYYGFLKVQGFKTNTRRRKLLTVRKLLRYLNHRKKIALDVGRKLPAPHKIERVPFTVPTNALIEAIRRQPSETDIAARNRVLLWTLAETGCLVSEIAGVQIKSWKKDPSGKPIVILGSLKSPRAVEVTEELWEAFHSLRARTDFTTQKNPAKSGSGSWIFLGFNKFGSLGNPITSRGVELLVKSYAERLGFPDLKPRTFRHSAVLRWFEQNISREEIQRRLGLRTAYAFRVYEPLIASMKERLKSSSETKPTT